jgi:hypothetical protein
MSVGKTASGAQTFNVTMTADNAYAIYLGDSVSATSLVGNATNLTAGDIWIPESYTLTAPNLSYIYIAAWSDDAVIQGLLADFNNITLGASVLSGSSPWEVTATGINLGSASPPPSLAALTTEILNANAATNPSLGWVIPTASPLTNGAGGIHGVTIAGVDSAARWMWYDNGLDTSVGTPPPPFLGFNHDEYLIYRIPVTAPEPATATMTLLGGLAMIRRLRKKQVAS